MRNKATVRIPSRRPEGRTARLLAVALLAGILLAPGTAFSTGTQREPQPALQRPASGKTVRQAPRISLWRRLFGYMTWQEALASTRTARDICRTVSRHITYTPDRGEEWPRPERVWQRHRGDCEDFALTILEMCHRKGLRAFIRLYYPLGRAQGHAVVIGTRPDGRLWFSSLGSYRETDSARQVDELVAAELGCHPSEMAVVDLTYEDVRRRISTEHAAGWADVASSR